MWNCHIGYQPSESKVIFTFQTEQYYFDAKLKLDEAQDFASKLMKLIHTLNGERAFKNQEQQE